MAKGMKSKGASVAIWILMALLVFGLAGFGIGNFGGTINTVGQVGDKDITVQAYNRALQQEINALSIQAGQAISFQQAQAMGVDRAVRARLVTLAALDNETNRLGISVGDDAIRDQILAIPSFQGLDGRFDREAYRYALQQSGLSESAFETSLREEMARGLLQGAILGGVTVSDTFTDTVLLWLSEGRNITRLRLTPADLPDPLPTPDSATLQAFYEANIADFTRPEAKRITYAWLTPDMLKDSITLDESALRTLYAERHAEYVQPERRLVERLPFASEEAAAAARARLDAGEVDFNALVAERGLRLSDLDMGDVSRADLGAAAEAVFALDAPGVVGPLPSDFGPALYRMNAVLAAQETPFEEARESLAAELVAERARRMIVERVDDLEDLLAGGASIEDLVAETEMALGQIDWHEGLEEGIAAYSAFRAAAANAALGDFPELVSLEDGGLLVLRLEEIIPAAPYPFAEVAERVRENWERVEVMQRLNARGAELLGRIALGTEVAALGPTPQVTENLQRDAFLDNVPADFVTTVFEMAEGETRLIPGDGVLHLVRLDAILPADPENEVTATLRNALAAQLSQTVAQDVFDFFAYALEREAGVRFNDAAINAVHAQIQ